MARVSPEDLWIFIYEQKQVRMRDLQKQFVKSQQLSRGTLYKYKRQLEQILLRGAPAAGFPTDLWTLARVTEVIERELGVTYHPGHVWRILTDMGWSCQKPEKRARERDEMAIARWRQEAWPRVEKKPGPTAGASC